MLLRKVTYIKHPNGILIFWIQSLHKQNTSAFIALLPQFHQCIQIASGQQCHSLRGIFPMMRVKLLLQLLLFYMTILKNINCHIHWISTASTLVVSMRLAHMKNQSLVIGGFWNWYNSVRHFPGMPADTLNSIHKIKLLKFQS